ncbi:lantibiotic dehydratase [Corynebacterium sp.]|uniref:lantibiotic dehydratase n=1 Tax=Corynebacterium sp. TaxID=1720 RepID=UPI0026DB4D65|nr:lantibiotic dehydratase [Corynebacterium sp.]MDO5077198.1 lantibiotic dehydratase [Corynebacterium sp.]
MTYKLRASVQGIRSAAVRWEEYQRFLDTTDGLAKIRLAYESSIISTTLRAFNPIVDANARAILAGDLRLDSKKGRKTLRHISILMARAATRATPSRLVGRVGHTHEPIIDAAPAAASQSAHRRLGSRELRVVLRDELEIGCAAPITAGEPDAAAPPAVRWNPSAIEIGSRYFVTAPRCRKEVFGSVGGNDVIARIVELARNPISWDQLVQQLLEEFNIADASVVEKAVLSLVKREFLLSSRSVGYAESCGEQGVDTRVSQCERFGGALRDWVIEHNEAEFEARRDADVSIGAQALESLEKCYGFLLRNGLLGTVDKGLAAKFAEILHERYGFSRVSLVDLIHPAFGISYQDVVDEFSAAQGASSAEGATSRLAECCARAAIHNDRWVDLNAPEIRRLIARDQGASDPEYAANFESFAVPVVPHRVPDGQDSQRGVQFLACDGVVAVPSAVLTARYRLLRGDDSQPVANSGAARKGVATAAIDWMSNDRKVNAIRESRQDVDYTLNVNAFATSKNELVCSDLYVWSDGKRVFIEKEDGTRLHFEPTSMVSLHLYPEWVRLLFVVATADWPALQWDWGSLERFHDFLPGVRFDNVILQRPKFRYRGEETLEAFNAWCDELGIGPLVRLGMSDRKVLVNRTTLADSSTLAHLLRSGDKWVDDAGIEHGVPLCTDSAGHAFHSELVVSFQCVRKFADPTREHTPAAGEGVAALNHQALLEFEDVDSYGYEQLIPATSDWCNLEIVPRGGEVHPLISLFSGLNVPFYFVRYSTKSGKACVRLRLLREHMMQADVRQFFAALVWDGWVSEVTEQQHRLEVERYGGQAGFAAFSELFIAESALLSWLASKKLLEPLSVSERAFLLRRWLHTSPLPYGVHREVARQQRSTRGGKTRVVIPDALADSLQPHREQIDAFFEAIARAMDNVVAAIPELREPWGVAAHLFCNRLGISTEEEQQVWKALAKTMPALERA